MRSSPRPSSSAATCSPTRRTTTRPAWCSWPTSAAIRTTSGWSTASSRRDPSRTWLGNSSSPMPPVCSLTRISQLTGCGSSSSRRTGLMESPMYKNYIDGAWVDAVSGDRFADTNPARPADVIGEFARSGAADVDAAVAAARRASQKAWRRTPAPLRGEIVARATRMLVERKADLVAGRHPRDGQGPRRLRVRRPGRDHLRRVHGRRGPTSCSVTSSPSGLPNRLAMTVREPVGVVGIVTPWNLPMLMPAWKLFPALVCGNTVVVKPAEDTPMSAVRLFEILEEAGVPPGVANLVTGYGPEAGEPLITPPGRRHDLVHRLTGGRRPHRLRRRPGPEARVAGDGWQERPRRVRRCRPGRGGHRGVVGRVLDERSALHRQQPTRGRRRRRR